MSVEPSGTVAQRRRSRWKVASKFAIPAAFALFIYAVYQLWFFDALWKWRVASAPLQPNGTTAIAFSSDGRKIVAARQGLIRVWSVPDLEPVQTLAVQDGRDGRIDELSFAPDDSCLAFGNYLGNVELWDTDAYRRLWVTNCFNGSVHGIVFSNDAELVIACGHGGNDDWGVSGEVAVLNAHDGKPIHENWPFDQTPLSVDYSPTEQLVAIGFIGGKIVFTPPDRYEPVATFDPMEKEGESTGFVRKIAFSPDGLLLAAARSKEALILDVASARVLHSISPNQTGTVSENFQFLTIEFLPDSKQCLIGASECVLIYDLASKKVIWRSKASVNMRSCAVAANGELFAIEHAQRRRLGLYDLARVRSELE